MNLLKIFQWNLLRKAQKKGKKKRKKEKVAEGLRRREAPAKARSGGLFDPLRYSGTGKIIPSRRFSEFENDAFLLYRPQ